MVFWIGGASLLTFLVTLALLPLLIVRMRADYFIERERHESAVQRVHPVVRMLAQVAKNVLGTIFVLAGIAMLALPGQGLLTILIGVTLLDFPGKRGLELRIVRRRPVLGAINWMRARAGKPPLIIPEH